MALPSAPSLPSPRRFSRPIHAIALVIAAPLLAVVATSACNTEIACEDNEDCPTDRVCGSENVCVLPGTNPDPNEPGGTPASPGPASPGVSPSPSVGPEPGPTPTPDPSANPEPSPGPQSACPGDVPCFRMIDSATKVCEGGDGFSVDCDNLPADAVGQDGEVVSPAPSYSFAGNFGLRDDVNGLIWELTQSDSIPHQNAVTRCDELTSDGLTWRLPTVREMFTLLDFGGNPTTNPGIPQPPVGLFHTKSVSSSNNTWYAVDLEDAFSGNQEVGVNGADDAFAKCVSGADLGGADFERVGQPADNIAMDVQTKITIQTVTNQAEYWSDALSQCNNLVLDGNEDWRLATAKDLALLLDPADFVSGRPLHSFFNISPRDIWSSSAVGISVAVLDQITGRFSDGSVSFARGFRCARGPDL